MACDGRIVDADSNTILSDGDKKYVICGSAVALVAGTFGRLFHQIAASPPKNYAAFRTMITEHMTDQTEWLIWDRRTERLYVGDVPVPRPIAGIGAGAAFGLGALEALPLAKSLDAAYKAVSIAMNIACRRNASCGGRIRIITVPKKGPVKIGSPIASVIPKPDQG